MSETKTFHLYTAGYKLWTPEELAKQAEKLNAWVADVRSNDFGCKTGSLMGPVYFWLWDYGNENPDPVGEVSLKQPEAAAHMLRIGLHTGRPAAILLCGCADHRKCHRTSAANHFQEWYNRNHNQNEVIISHLYPGDQKDLFQ